MPRNIEIKARIENLASLTAKVAEIADQGPFEVVQDDTFFKCENGRMKLRIITDTKGELIFYRRQNQAGPKESSYEIYPTSSPDVLRDVLALACGTIGHVCKHRTVFMAGRTRIHLDKVEGLGHFLELEVALVDGETNGEGIAVVYDLLEKLGIHQDKLVAESYLDMLNQRSNLPDKE